MSGGLTGSGSTFTAPSPATRGLQPYDLEGQKRRRATAPLGFTLSAQFRKPLRRKQNHSNTHATTMKKEDPMRQTIEAMTDTLSKTVSGLIASNPADLADQLQKNFAQFKSAIITEVDGELAKAAPDEEELLLKGMGTVGRVVHLAHHIHRECENIKGGKSYEGAEPDDECDDGTKEMLDHLNMMGQMAMHHAVNHHVEGASPDEEEHDGMHMVVIPHAYEDAESYGKTDLPEDLVKFIVDPALVQNTALELGASLMMMGGVSERALGKVLAGGDLAKAFPPKKGSEDDQDDASIDGDDRPGAGGGQPMGNVGGGDDGEDDNGASMGGGAPQGGMDSPLDVLGRIAAALMIQLSQVQDLQEGAGADADDAMGEPGDDGDSTDDGNEDDDGNGSVVPQPKNPVAKADEGADLQKDGASLTISGKLSAGSINPDELQKLVDAGVEKQLADLRPALEKLLAQPEPPKAFVGVQQTLTKAQDTGGVNIADQAEQLAAKLEKMSPDDRALAMIKLAQTNPDAQLAMWHVTKI